MILFGQTMKHFCDEWIREWCNDNGWTDLYIEKCHYWAFPPGAFMPEPIPSQTLRLIKAEKGLCSEERNWLIAAGICSVTAIILSYVLRNPMPLVFAFAFDAVTAAQLEIDEI